MKNKTNWTSKKDSLMFDSKETVNKYIKIDTGIYPFPIHVFIGETKFLLQTMKEKLIKKSFKELKYKLNNDDNHAGKFLKGDDNNMIIWVRNEINTIQDLCILNHEILHACVCVHRIIGSELTFESEESYTYLYEHLCKQIYKELPMFKDIKIN